MPVTVDAFGLGLLLSGLFFLVFLRKPLRFPNKPGSRAFVVALVGCALWAASLGVAYLVDLSAVTYVAASTRMLSATVISVGWFLLAVQVTRSRSPPRSLVVALAAYFAIEVLVHLTNGLHHLAIRPDLLAHGEPFEPAFQEWFWLQATINYGLIGAATLLLAVQAIRSGGLHRTQTAALSVAALPPLLANVVTVAGVVDLAHDITPFGMLGSAAILSWALYRAEFLDVVPVGRQTAVEEMHDAVVTVDGEGRVVDCNARARDLFDVEGDYFGRPFPVVFASLPDDVVAEIESGSTADTQLSVETGDGTRHFDCSTSTVGLDDATEGGRVVVFRDVTERTRHEQRLLQQNETLDDFASVVSHDVQGPLMEIRGSADLAATTEDVSHMEHVLEAADRMDELVEDLHELARTGQRIEDEEPVALDDLARSVWETTYSGDATLEVDADVTVVADAERLRQCLENCYRNAVEHGSTSPRSPSTPEDAVEHGGEDVTVSVTATPDGFAVADDGPGIPPEERDSVFDRGYTTSADGTGLGLGIVEQIAHAHGWSVAVGESEDGGARFEFSGVETR